MDVQQVIALLLVAGAAFYLGRLAWLAWRSASSDKGRCSSGCGKCEFAQGDPSSRASTRATPLIRLDSVRLLNTPEPLPKQPRNSPPER
jgi:hypothetical protein